MHVEVQVPGQRQNAECLLIRNVHSSAVSSYGIYQNACTCWQTFLDFRTRRNCVALMNTLRFYVNIFYKNNTFCKYVQKGCYIILLLTIHLKAALLCFLYAFIICVNVSTLSLRRFITHSVLIITMCAFTECEFTY